MPDLSLRYTERLQLLLRAFQFQFAEPANVGESHARFEHLQFRLGVAEGCRDLPALEGSHCCAQFAGNVMERRLSKRCFHGHDYWRSRFCAGS